jgi:hypothetical protein
MSIGERLSEIAFWLENEAKCVSENADGYRDHGHGCYLVGLKISIEVLEEALSELRDVTAKPYREFIASEAAREAGNPKLAERVMSDDKTFECAETAYLNQQVMDAMMSGELKNLHLHGRGK